MNKIYLGKHAAAAVNDRFRIVFLRQDEQIVSILSDNAGGFSGCACGRNGRAEACICLSGTITADSAAAEAAYRAHAADRFTEQGSTLIWQTPDGTEFPMTLCEASDGTAPAGSTLAEKMAHWNQKAYAFRTGEDSLCAEIITARYAAVFLVRRDMLYCRLGQNGYCEKGYAMLPGVVLRRNECRMIPDLTAMQQPYHPQACCFAENGCAFPADGGWYWPVRSVTETEIRLFGCGGDVYTISAD